jgi:GT2 family glycosyltransferase
MTDTLITITTKNRPEHVNVFVQNLINQKGEFDLYISDMCTDTKLLFNNSFLRSGLERLRTLGHEYTVENVLGTNQLYGYNAGLNHALTHGYKYCLAGDDDIVYELGWMAKGRQHMVEDINLGICAGITLNPLYSLESQTIGIGLPLDTVNHPDFRGRLQEADYYHCIFVPPTTTPKYYEVTYGGFFYRTEDAISVGGFPIFLSPLGFRGEMILQTAIFFMGKKMMVDPTMISWHYQCPYGGLRFDAPTKEKHLAHDFDIWHRWVAKRLPKVEPP